MLTRKQVEEYLPTYSSETIFQALSELSNVDNSINPSSELFDEDIVERLEDVLESIEESIANTSNQIVEAKQYALKLIQEKGIVVSEKVLEELFQLCIQSGIARAKLLHQAGNAAFHSTLAHLQGEELKQATKQHIKKLHAFNILLNDGEKLNAVLEEYQIKNASDSLQTVLTEAEEIFDAEIYRNELLGGNEPKKPTTRHGARLMLKAMLG